MLKEILAVVVVLVVSGSRNATIEEESASEKIMCLDLLETEEDFDLLTIPSRRTASSLAYSIAREKLTACFEWILSYRRQSVPFVPLEDSAHSHGQ